MAGGGIPQLAVTEELDEETLAFAHRVLDLAREGTTDELAQLV